MNSNNNNSNGNINFDPMHTDRQHMGVPMVADQHHRYTIVTNNRGRRILVVNRLLNIKLTPELTDDSFDAIFINIAHDTYEENRLIIRWLSPSREGKCFLKPRFATSSLQQYMRFAVQLLDGFCESPTDDVFTDYIEMVYGNIERYHIDRTIISDHSTTSRMLSNIFKYQIARGQLTYTNQAIRSLTQGYTTIFLSWYDNQETLFLDERVKFNRKMIELGFAEPSRFLERIHICPKCGNSHQLFIEACPNCKSSDIQEEPMIHHFRCANISPESAYAQDGQLICPKCKKLLRHIGVDYDRPATVHTCNCGNTFLTPEMRVRCTSCGNVHSPAELIPLDIYEYRITPEGLRAFATDDALFRIESTDIYSGRATYENFIESIRTFNRLSSYAENALLIFRYTYDYTGDDSNLENWKVFDLLRSIISRFATIKITTLDTNIYILIVVHSSSIEEEHTKMRQSLDRIFYEASDEDSFSAHWLKTYRMFHGEDPESLIDLITENIEAKVNNQETL